MYVVACGECPCTDNLCFANWIQLYAERPSEPPPLELVQGLCCKQVVCSLPVWLQGVCEAVLWWECLVGRCSYCIAKWPANKPGTGQLVGSSAHTVSRGLVACHGEVYILCVGLQVAKTLWIRSFVVDSSSAHKMKTWRLRRKKGSEALRELPVTIKPKIPGLRKIMKTTASGCVAV